MPGDGLLSTGQAAQLLGCSRQHVVDLCSRGDLPVIWAGRHRRVRRTDVERILQPSSNALSDFDLTRDQERSLWLHRALLATLVAEPEATMSLARRNVTRLMDEQRQATMTAHWAQQWLRLLDRGVDAVADVLVSREPHAVELRQNSPFAGALPQPVRTRVLASFQQHWRDEHTERSAASSSPRSA